jgi:hypothetical protein
MSNVHPERQNQVNGYGGPIGKKGNINEYNSNPLEWNPKSIADEGANPKKLDLAEVF